MLMSGEELFGAVAREAVEVMTNVIATATDALALVAELALDRPQISDAALRTAMEGLARLKAAERELTSALHPLLIEITTPPPG